MSKAEDDSLMKEINGFADRAQENKHSHADIRAIAMTLGGQFKHRSVDEIEDTLKDVWRSRDHFWMS